MLLVRAQMVVVRTRRAVRWWRLVVRRRLRGVMGWLEVGVEAGGGVDRYRYSSLGVGRGGLEGRGGG